MRRQEPLACFALGATRGLQPMDCLWPFSFLRAKDTSFPPCHFLPSCPPSLSWQECELWVNVQSVWRAGQPSPISVRFYFLHHTGSCFALLQLWKLVTFHFCLSPVLWIPPPLLSSPDPPSFAAVYWSPELWWRARHCAKGEGPNSSGGGLEGSALSGSIF